MKETFYFSHDFNAFNDSKVQDMIMDHGLESYGLYWWLIESLAQETERWFLPKNYKKISYILRVDEEMVRSVVEDYELFDFDDKNFWNKRLDRHFDQRAKKSKIAKKNAENRWKKQRAREASQGEGLNAVALQPQCKGNAIKESKGKERKENTSKNKTAEGEKNLPEGSNLNSSKDLQEELRTLVDFWNAEDESGLLKISQRQKNPTCKMNKRIMMRCRKATPDMLEIYKKLRKKYDLDDFTHGIKEYAYEITQRIDDREKGDYCSHRFSFFNFLKQENGFRSFVTRDSKP